MPTILSDFQTLLEKIKQDFPEYTFFEGNFFGWSSSNKTISFASVDENDSASLLHELAHAQLGHTYYQFDVELIRREAAAWQYTKTTLSPIYNITIDQLFIEECMEGYREWLYKRSLCPQCNETGLQIQKKTYSCINCRSSWLVNDARKCAIRRLKLRGQS